MVFLLVLSACGRPTDLDKARAAIDSALAKDQVEGRMTVSRSDSLSDGHHAYRNPEGRLLMEGELLNGQRNGVWTSYGENGQVKSRSEYRDGALQGLTTVFQDNGMLKYSGENRNGHPVGEWRFFDTTGGLAKTVVFDSTGRQVR